MKLVTVLVALLFCAGAAAQEKKHKHTEPVHRFGIDKPWAGCIEVHEQGNDMDFAPIKEWRCPPKDEPIISVPRKPANAPAQTARPHHN